MKQLSFALIISLLLAGCSGTALQPAQVKEAPNLPEGQSITVKGSVTNVFELLGICYFELSNRDNPASIKVLCRQSSPDIGQEITVKIVPADIIKIGTWKMRVYKQIE
jgi:hypothetical protein